MTPRILEVTANARRDLTRRKRYLAEVRGRTFAIERIDSLVAWLERIANGGEQLGTAVADVPSDRSFGYRKEATIVARFLPGRMIVLRVYFKGQDWRRRLR